MEQDQDQDRLFEDIQTELTGPFHRLREYSHSSLPSIMSHLGCIVAGCKVWKSVSLRLDENSGVVTHLYGVVAGSAIKDKEGPFFEKDPIVVSWDDGSVSTEETQNVKLVASNPPPPAKPIPYR